MAEDATTRPGPGRLLVTVLAGAALLTAGCGAGGGGRSTGAGAPGSPGTTAASPGATAAGPYGRAYGGASSPPAGSIDSIGARTSRLGTILTDAAGRTLYLFEKDQGTTSACYGACAAAWPPAAITATPHVTGGAVAGLLGTTARSDGTSQLTYAGHPLYYFARDRRPGDVTGEGLRLFGAGWFVLGPPGQKIQK